MKFLKSLQINSLVTAIVYVILGLLFIILPEAITRSAAVLLGVVLLIAGAAYIIDYFRKWQIEYKANGLAIGILLVFGALFLFFQNEVIATIVPLVLGFAVVLSGTIKLQNAIVLYRAKEGMWIPVLVLAALSLVFGFIIMINPFAAMTTLIVIIGVGLLISGLTDLVIIFLMSRRSNELEAAGRSRLDKNVIDTDHVQSPKDAVFSAMDELNIPKPEGAEKK